MIQTGVYGVDSRSSARMNVSFLSLDIYLTPSLSPRLPKGFWYFRHALSTRSCWYSGGEGGETASVKISAPTYSAHSPRCRQGGDEVDLSARQHGVAHQELV